MINSATALRLLRNTSICTIIEDRNHLAVGYGVFAADLKVWLAQKGFRVDTARSTFVRWTETWSMTGEIIPVKVGDRAIAFWFSQVPREVATSVAQYGDAENLQSIYAINSGMASLEICKTLGISLGGFFEV